MSDLVPIDEVVYFDVTTHDPSTGAITDADSTPTFEVFEEATDTDIGVGGNLTKRTSKTGNYRGTFTASAANGFEAGKWYSVIASATVNAIAAKAVAKSFRCGPAESSAGVPKGDVSHFGGSAGTFAAGIPEVKAASLANDAITAVSIAAGAFTAAKFAAGAFDAVWTVTVRLLTAGTNIVLAKGVGVTGFTDISALAVNAEVVDALNVDTYAEPGQGAPAATASIAAKIGYLFKMFRNKKTQTATDFKLFNDAETVVDQKSAITEAAGAVTRGEIVSGP
jgi:hypothetical protein